MAPRGVSTHPSISIVYQRRIAYTALAVSDNQTESAHPIPSNARAAASPNGNQRAYAHTTPGPEDTWEPLEEHLNAVAERAAWFASAFGAEAWGRLAGLWHDLGKYSEAFQSYLRASAARAGFDSSTETAPGRVDHSTAGAQHAVTRAPHAGRLIAYAIAGHHAGLADRGSPSSAGTLEARLAKTEVSIADAIRRAPRAITEQSIPPPPHLRLGPGAQGAGFSFAFLTRMLFSALVDADYLATEAFLDPGRSTTRTAAAPQNLGVLAEAVRGAIQTAQEAAIRASTSPRVARCREAVASDCAAAAGRAPGFFTLTVPTGGGKTLCSMLFALEHARCHGLRRVVVAVPFTSIIDQNAEVYRRVFGDGVVLEHHTALNPDRETPWRRLTSENWDAPVVVTTTVQLFESLFACRPSSCRKLHNIARSVIILDEAQAMPVGLLRPILAALRELVVNYGCSVVLCTATQPALAERREFPIGLPLGPEREIIRNVPALFDGLRRTRVALIGRRDDADVAGRLLAAPSGLVIVNTRRHAAALYRRVLEADGRPPGEGGPLHLSALMCPVHRGEVLAEVRRRLRQRARCHLVSTQVIEAGVDVDFPLVLRALAGLDSIAQSAGRCNREGRADTGLVEVFVPDAASEGRLPSAIAAARNAAAQVLPDFADDPLSPPAVEAYFRQHYWKQSDHGWDRPDVMGCFGIAPGAAGAPAVLDLNFEEAASRFVMIDQFQRGVVVPYGEEGRALVGALLSGRPPDRAIWVRLQRHSVSIPEPTLARLTDAGIVTETQMGIAVLADPSAYDPLMGLLVDRDTVSPESLCC